MNEKKKTNERTNEHKNKIYSVLIRLAAVVSRREMKIDPRNVHVNLFVNRFTWAAFRWIYINTRLTFDHCQNVIETSTTEKKKKKTEK